MTAPGKPAAFLAEALAYQGEDCVCSPYAQNGVGYGKIVVKKKAIQVHRIVCEAFNGPPPFLGAEASHQCGNGHLGCINGRHLKWKTRKGNAQDMVEHGRSQQGTKHHASRLTEADVRFVWDNPGMSQSELGRLLKVCGGTIGAVRRGSTWRWLTSVLDRRAA
jgi:hypothetical protein